MILLCLTSAQCELDPIPTSLVKRFLPSLLPVITAIINKSLELSHFPLKFKNALVKPLLKKSSLDQNCLNNYRPVSNLPFLSKVCEKVVCSRLIEHMDANHYFEKYQSAYRKFHSTESALLRVHNDIIKSLDSKKCVALIMLDISAAYDTIDHQLLLRRLQYQARVVGDALNWMESYLENRSQQVLINGIRSSPIGLKFGIPQGSVLGPVLFCIYTLPLGPIIQKYNLDYHFFADDSQIYIEFKSTECLDAELITLQKCIAEIKTWMDRNFLRLNSDKTEFILFTKKHHTLSNINADDKLMALDLCNTSVFPSNSVRNLGAIFDKFMCMEEHIKSTCRAAYHALWKISKIRKYMDMNCTKQLVPGLVISKLDYANAILYGLPDNVVKQLQHVQNAAAKVIFPEKKI